MDTTQQVPQAAGSARRPRTWPRRLAVSAGLVAALGAGIGIGVATQNTGISQATYNASQAQVSALKDQVSALNSQVSSLNDAVTSWKGQAQQATDIAQAKAKSDYAARNAALAATRQTVNQEAAQLRQELGQVQANSISGDGVYVVGKDIKSGTWHTSGSGNAGANDCYFATLNSTNTADIADNNNFDGPETVNVSGAYAFEVNGPCTWVLVP